VTKNV